MSHAHGGLSGGLYLNAFWTVTNAVARHEQREGATEEVADLLKEIEGTELYKYSIIASDSVKSPK